ncbi:MAG TPA: tyrosine-type recombinase/integrase [Armatimonadota bacterium]|jgi:site-specific recombinase XerD
MTTPTVADMIESFFEQRLIKQRQASPATIRTYSDALRLLLVFTAEHVEITPARLTMKQLDRDTVLAFLDHLETVRKNSIRTRNARRAALRSFYQYVGYLDPTALAIVQRVLAIPAKRTIKTLFGYLTREELTGMLAVPDQRTLLGRRDYTLLLFMARTGARVSEVIGVNANDVSLQGKASVRLRGKGGRERVTPLGADVATALGTVCSERGCDMRMPSPVFTNGRGQRLTRFAITHLVRRTVAEASMTMPSLMDRSISPHTLRHTAAMYLLQAGVDLNIIRSWLGHVNLDTTHHYVEADLQMKEKALEQSGIVEPHQARYVASDAVLALLERYR